MCRDRDGKDETERTGSSTKQISREELLAELQQLQDELGRVPKTADMKDDGVYSYGVYYDRFGSWKEAVTEAGFETEENNRETDRISEKELIAELNQLYDDLGQVPKTTDMDKHGKYSATTYRNRYGSWDEAVSEAGFDPAEIPRGSTRIPEEDLLAELNRLSDEIGAAPRKIDMENYGKFSAGTYTLRFGSWFGALEEAEIH